MTGPETKMEVPAKVREFAEKTIEQAEKGFDAFMGVANKTVGMVPNPTTELSKKILSITDQNMRSAFDHARRLLNARNVQEAVKIQTEYLQTQFTTAAEQIKQLGGGAVNAAKDLTKEESEKLRTKMEE